MAYEKWLIYGAYGTTAGLIAEEATRRGHRPMLAGRSAEKLVPLADRLGLAWLQVDLLDEDQLRKSVGDFELVFNAAGPYVHTAEPMARACLEAKTSYLDVAGEVQVLEHLLSLDQPARKKDMTIIPGVGFNVLASDCLARYVAEQVDHPSQLQVATHWITEQISPGSVKTMIESYPIGILARRRGKLVRVSARSGHKRLQFLNGMHTVLPATLGDLASAYRTTGIANIHTFTAVPERTAAAFSRTEPIFRVLYSFRPIRRLASKWAERASRRSKDHERPGEPSQVWALAQNEVGQEKQAWLETAESYQFTAAAAVRSVEKVLSDRPRGALTPALAFGADFVLEIPGTRRVDRLEEGAKELS